MSDAERQRQERHAAYQRDAAPLIAALRDAGVDPTDFGRLVNRPIPGVLLPSRFDATRAVPVLLDWLPRIANEQVRESVVRHLKIKAARPAAAQPLLDEFSRGESVNYKWVVADVLQYVGDPSHYPQIVRLAADHSHGTARQPLVDMLWRVKTAQADQLLVKSISDPDVARSAMSALRRRIGNTPARPLIEPMLNHPDGRVRQAAKDYLRRIDKALATAGPHQDQTHKN